MLANVIENIPTIVVVLVLVLFYDQPIKGAFRWIRSKIRAAGNGAKAG